MNKPIISIIVPVYNVEKYLPRCIDSILAQTFTDFELLLIDDGSIDNSGNICDDYAKKDNRIRVFHKQNGGVSSARNLGLDNAKGEWITFVDSDDLIDNETLNDYLRYNADLICQGLKQINAMDNSIEDLKKYDFLEASVSDHISYALYIMFINGSFGYIWNKLFKHRILKDHNIRFIEGISIREDEIFVFKYCQYIKSIVLLPTINYNYVHYQNSLMRRKYINPIELTNAIEKSYNISLKLPLTPEFRKAIEINRTDSLVWAGWMLYHKKHLLDYSKRIDLLKIIYESHKNTPTINSKRFCKLPLKIMDFVYVIKYLLKTYVAPL